MPGSLRDGCNSLSASSTQEKWIAARVALTIFVMSLATFSLNMRAFAQSAAVGNCKPVSERTTDVGCWIIAHQPVGQLTSPTFWYLDTFLALSAAEAAKGPHGTVVESLGKTWLLRSKGRIGDPLGANALPGSARFRLSLGKSAPRSTWRRL